MKLTEAQLRNIIRKEVRLMLEFIDYEGLGSPYDPTEDEDVSEANWVDEDDYKERGDLGDDDRRGRGKPAYPDGPIEESKRRRRKVRR